jgi:hypothetical protein
VPTPTTVIRRIGEDGVSTRTLDRMVETAQQIDGVLADEVRPGDFVIVRTRNSVYSLAALGEGRFRAAGGWFGAGGEGQEVRVTGCTWGGAAIHTRVVAGVGMFLEFDNGVRTTRIRQVTLMRGGSGTTH